MLDISADAGHGVGIFDHTDGCDGPGALAERLKRAATHNFGTAGPAFLARLIKEGPGDVGATVRDMMDAFEKEHVPAHANGQVRRAGRFLALVGAAGELAIAWEIAPWSEGAALTAAAHALDAWTGGRGGVEAAEIHDGIKRVRSYLSAFGESHFDPAEAVDPARIAPNRAGWRRGTGEDREWWILPEQWRKICKGVNPRPIARALAERGLILRDSEGKFQVTKRTPMGAMRVYVVAAQILRGDGDET